MIDKLPTVKRLMRHLQQIPFLASKNMYRVVSYFLHMDEEKIEQFCQTLKESKQKIVPCSSCFVWKERDGNCSFCKHKDRDQSTICVVESWQELLVIERTESYRGLYHVLGGVICPLDGMGPEDLTIDALLARMDDSVKEVIFAMNHTPEGEATAAFIARKLQGKSVKISCLAKGIPLGTNLEFMDRLTVGKAVLERKPF